MGRRGRGSKRSVVPSLDHASSAGTTIIRGTSTRPLISYAANQPPVILADIAEPISEPPSPQKLLKPEDDEKSDGDDQSSMEDDRLYCVCRRLYDGRTMIACDRCDNWYHNDCVGIDESLVELVDIFICPNCQTGVNKETTWKTKCARPGCLFASRLLSKYCSDWCGIEQAATRLNNASTQYHRFWDLVQAAKRPEGIVIENKQLIESSNPEIIDSVPTDILSTQLKTQLEELLRKKSIVENQIQLATNRLKYLSYAISRWENMCLETARALQIQEDPVIDQSSPATPTVAKPKKGYPRGRGRGRSGAKKSETSALGSATSRNEAPCGFDVRLIWDDRDWAQWTSSEQFSALLQGEPPRNIKPAPGTSSTEDIGHSSEAIFDHGIEEGVICLIMKKKCDRHLGWQKTRENDFQTELNTLNALLDKLLNDMQRLKEEIEEREKLWQFKSAKKTTSYSQAPP